MEELPQEWLITQLHEVGAIVTGKTPSKKKPEFFDGEIPFLKPGDINNQGKILSVSETISELGAETVPTIPKDSIVVTCIGNLGRAAITSERSATNQQINSVIPFTKVNTKYLYYYVLTLKSWMQYESSATTVAIINKSKFSTAPVTLAPLAEQKVIADKLDSLLAQVEATKARLDRVPDILKRFRQSVLAAAVSGRLTEECVSEFTTIDQVSKVIGGLTKNSKRKDMELLKPFLRVANVYENELRLDDVATIGVMEKELERVLLHHGDLLVVEGNGSLDQIGRVALWSGEIEDCVHQNHLIKIRPLPDNIEPKFLLFYLMSPQGKAEIVGRATSGAGLYTLSISKISTIRVPVFGLIQQTEIVRRVEELFAFADKIEQQTQTATERVDKLTQSILAKAFRGELTKDWRAANPDLISGENSAEALLEKIRLEREALKPKKKARVKKVTKVT